MSNINITISIEGATKQGWKNLGKFTFPMDDLDHVIRSYTNPAMRVSMWVGDILVTTDMANQIEADETFFYASVAGAKVGKVWVEEAHAFMSPQFKSTIDGGCVDINDLDIEFEEEGGWYAFVRENIYTDVFGYTPVTGEDGMAVVMDEDLANKCKEWGYEVISKGNPDDVSDDGTPGDWYEIFPQGGEEEYKPTGGITDANDDNTIHTTGYFGEPVESVFDALANMLFIHPEYIPTTDEMSAAGIETRRLVTDYIDKAFKIHIYDILDGRGHVVDRKPLTPEEVRNIISNTSHDVMPTGETVTYHTQVLGKVWRDKTADELAEEWHFIWDELCEHSITFLGYHKDGHDSLIEFFKVGVDDEDIII